MASIDTILERFESDLAGGLPINHGEYLSLTNASRRLLEDLGLVATASAQPIKPEPLVDLSQIQFITRPKPEPEPVESEPAEASADA